MDQNNTNDPQPPAVSTSAAAADFAPTLPKAAPAEPAEISAPTTPPPPLLDAPHPPLPNPIFHPETPPEIVENDAKLHAAAVTPSFAEPPPPVVIQDPVPVPSRGGGNSLADWFNGFFGKLFASKPKEAHIDVQGPELFANLPIREKDQIIPEPPPPPAIATELSTDEKTTEDKKNAVNSEDFSALQLQINDGPEDQPATPAAEAPVSPLPPPTTEPVNEKPE